MHMKASLVKSIPEASSRVHSSSTLQSAERNSKAAQGGGFDGVTQSIQSERQDSTVEGWV